GLGMRGPPIPGKPPIPPRPPPPSCAQTGVHKRQIRTAANGPERCILVSLCLAIWSPRWAKIWPGDSYNGWDGKPFLNGEWNWQNFAVSGWKICPCPPVILAHRMNDSEAHLRSQMMALLPRLRRFALATTGKASDADDLVQDTVERALRNLDR